jgi:hypothetical protein
MQSRHDPNIAASVPPTEDPIQRIDRALTAGHIVFAQVDREPNNAYNFSTEQHWVILLKRTAEGDNYLVLNPAVPATEIKTQFQSLIPKYGNRDPNRSHEDNLANAIKSAMIYSR